MTPLVVAVRGLGRVARAIDSGAGAEKVWECDRSPDSGRVGAKKNRAEPGLFPSGRLLGKNSFAKTAPHLRQLSQRKFLNFNDNGLNDCGVHVSLLLQKDTYTDRGCQRNNLEMESLGEVSGCSVAVSPNG